MKVNKSRLTRLLVSIGLETAESWSLEKMNDKINSEGGIARFLDPPDSRPADPDLKQLCEELLNAASVEVVDDPVEEATPEVPEKVAEEPAPEPDFATPSEEPQEVAPTQPGDEADTEIEEKEAATAESEGGVAVKVRKKRGRPAKAAAAPKKKGRPAKAANAPKKRKSKGGNGKYEGYDTWGEYLTYLAKNPKPIPTDGIMAVTIEELKWAGRNPDKPKPVTKEEILGVLKEKFKGQSVPGMRTGLNNNIPSRLRWMYGIHVWKERTKDGELGYYIPGDGKKPQPKKSKKSE